MSYHHLTASEKCHIYGLHVEKTSVTDITKNTGQNKGTIGRELRRNRGQRSYRSAQAKELAQERHKNCANAPQIAPSVWSLA